MFVDQGAIIGSDDVGTRDNSHQPLWVIHIHDRQVPQVPHVEPDEDIVESVVRSDRDHILGGQVPHLGLQISVAQGLLHVLGSYDPREFARLVQHGEPLMLLLGGPLAALLSAPVWP